jgi:hypothetical protein
MLKNKSFAALSSLMCWCILAGCSVDAAHHGTVEAGPLLCLLKGEDAGDGTAGAAPMHVACSVGIGNATASEEGIDTSVTNILSVYVLRETCPAFGKDEVLASSARFNEEVRSGLAGRYVQSGSGWTVQSVECGFSEISAK